MARKGRELEELVRDLETFLAAAPVEIKSPDYLVDKDTGKPREVDVSIRAKVGSIDILIIVECRDRRHRQDVTWIEQLIAKRESVGAHGVVAVSATPFSDGAVKKAAAGEIELRTFAAIDRAVALGWADELLAKTRNFRLTWSNMALAFADDFDVLKGSELPLAAEEWRMDVPLLIAPNGDRLSISEAIIGEIAPNLAANFPPGVEEWNSHATMSFDDDSDKYVVELKEGKFHLVEFNVDFCMELQEPEFSIQRRVEYANRNGSISHSLEARVNVHGMPITYGFHENANRSKSAIRVSRNDNDSDTILQIVRWSKDAALTKMYEAKLLANMQEDAG